MKSLEELLEGRDMVWFELLKRDFKLFVDFSAQNKLSWKWGGEIKMGDFENHTDFAHISIDKNSKCCFVPMVMWLKKEYNYLKI